MATEQKKTMQEVFRDIAAGIVAVYTVLVLCVFPLCTNDKYFDILSFRFALYWKGTCIVLALLGALLLLYAFLDYKEYQGMHVKESLAMLRPENLTKHMRATDWCFLAFMAVMLISMAGSGYPYETFWGNRGRYQGVLCWLMYAAEYVFITRFYRYKDWHLKAFLFGGVLVCLWGITDFFKLNLFHFLDDVGERQLNAFVSSVGNINTYTNLTAMLLAAATVLFLTEKRLPALVFDYVCMGIFALACVMGVSDNVVFAYAALFGFLPLWAGKSKRGVVRYFAALATVFSTIAATGAVVNAGIDNIAVHMGGSFLISLGQSKAALLLSAALWLVTAVLLLLAKHQAKTAGSVSAALDAPTPKAVRRGWGVFLVLGFVLVLAMIIDANTGGHPEFWQPYANAIIFNDDWGTHRGHNWKLAWNYFTQDMPLFQKIFGHGPDTYYIITMDNYFSEMTQKYGEVYDSAHNEYLNYLMTVGIAGLAAYIGIMSTALTDMFRRAHAHAGAMACAFAVIAYLGQALINIAIPITAPVFITLLAVGCAMGREN